MNKIQKIYYSPGIISLVFLPILMLWHLHKEGVFEKHYAIEVFSYFFPPDIDIEEYATYFKDSLLKDNYIEIRLTGNEEDINKLHSAQLIMQDLKKSKAMTKGLCINFGESSKYWELVKAIDICHIEDLKTFSLYKNNLWIFNLKNDTVKSTPLEFPVFDCSYHIDSPKVPELSFKEKALVHLSRFYPLLIIFILMVIGAILKIHARHYS